MSKEIPSCMWSCSLGDPLRSFFSIYRLTLARCFQTANKISKAIPWRVARVFKSHKVDQLRWMIGSVPTANNFCASQSVLLLPFVLFDIGETPKCGVHMCFETVSVISMAGCKFADSFAGVDM